jgi:hypothetical protein
MKKAKVAIADTSNASGANQDNPNGHWQSDRDGSGNRQGERKKQI